MTGPDFLRDSLVVVQQKSVCPQLGVYGSCCWEDLAVVYSYLPLLRAVMTVSNTVTRLSNDRLDLTGFPWRFFSSCSAKVCLPTTRRLWQLLLGRLGSCLLIFTSTKSRDDSQQYGNTAEQ